MKSDTTDFVPFGNFNSSASEKSETELDKASKKASKEKLPTSNKRKFADFETNDYEYVSSSSDQEKDSSKYSIQAQLKNRSKNGEPYMIGYDGQKLPQWLKNTKGLFDSDRNLGDLLNDEVKSFVEYITPTMEEHMVRSWVLEKLKRSLASVFKKSDNKRIDVVCFGSYITGLYLPTSDLDVSVCVVSTITNQLCKEYEDKILKKKLLFSISLALRKSGFSNFCEVIASARVPIVKTVELNSKIAMDISINALGGLKAAKIVSRYVEEEFPVVLRGLSLIVKVFLHQRHMNEVYTGGLGSFAVVMMLISFLQMHPKIQSGSIDPKKNMGILLCEFFELYGKRFNYESVGIVINNGGKYIRKPVGDDRDRGYSRPCQRLYLEDPGDPTNDVTKGTYGMSRIRQMFSGAFDLLTNSMFKYHQIRKFGKHLSEVNEEPQSTRGSHTRFPNKKRDMGGKKSKSSSSQGSNSSKYDLNMPISFLSSVITISNQTIRKRQDIVTLFYNNVFQNELGVTFTPHFSAHQENSLSASTFNKKEQSAFDFPQVANSSLKDMAISFDVPGSPEYVEDSDFAEEGQIPKYKHDSNISNNSMSFNVVANSSSDKPPKNTSSKAQLKKQKKSSPNPAQKSIKRSSNNSSVNENVNGSSSKKSCKKSSSTLEKAKFGSSGVFSGSAPNSKRNKRH